MSTVHLTPERLHVRLSTAEKIGGLHGDLDIPRSAIQSADVVTDGLSAATGMRAPGLAIPGRVQMGTWRGRGTRCYVSVRRDQPALRLTLSGKPGGTVLVSTPDAAAVVAGLRSE